jgi:hypothetical protein
MPKPLPTTKRRPRVPVLIVLGPEAGTVEVYGEQLAVHFAQRLDVHRANEAMADELIDATLPRKFRPLFIPRNLAGVEHCRPRTAESEARRRWELEFLRELRATREALAPRAVPAAIERARRARP